MKRLNSIALGTTALMGSLLASSALFATSTLASSSIEVIGDETRDVRVTIERIDNDGDTVIREVTGGGYTIHDRTEEGRLVRVELIEDDEDGEAQTRVCIVEDDGDMECSGEMLRTHRILREQRHAEREGSREIHVRHMTELHPDYQAAPHARHRSRSTSDHTLLRLDSEVDRLRSELRSLQRQLDLLDRRGRDRSDLGEMEEHVFVWSSNDDTEFEHEVIIDFVPEAGEREVFIEIAPYPNEHSTFEQSEHRYVWVDEAEEDGSITVSKTIEIIIDDNEVVDLEFGHMETSESHVVIDLDEEESVTVIELKEEPAQP